MTSLRNIGALVQKEWGHYFGSPIAYVALFVWTLLAGGFFALFFGNFTLASQQSQGPMGGEGLSLNDRVVEGLLHNMSIVALFLTPMITMRLFAEEKRQGTIELLSTAPLTDLQIVLGKFFGALALFAALIAAGFVNFIFFLAYAEGGPDWWPVAVGCLGLLLLGGAFISLGLFVSTLTKNQIVAATLTFGLGLALLMLPWPASLWPNALTEFVAYFGIVRHAEDFYKGIIDLKDLVFYLTFTVFSLFLAHQSVESQRWRA